VRPFGPVVVEEHEDLVGIEDLEDSDEIGIILGQGVKRGVRGRGVVGMQRADPHPGDTVLEELQVRELLTRAIRAAVMAVDEQALRAVEVVVGVVADFVFRAHRNRDGQSDDEPQGRQAPSPHAFSFCRRRVRGSPWNLLTAALPSFRQVASSLLQGRDAAGEGILPTPGAGGKPGNHGLTPEARRRDASSRVT